MVCTTPEQLECVLTRAGTTPLKLTLPAWVQPEMLELIASRNHSIHSLTMDYPNSGLNIGAFSESNMKSLRYLDVNGAESEEEEVKKVLDLAILSNHEELDLKISLSQRVIRTLDHPIFLRAAKLGIKGCRLTYFCYRNVLIPSASSRSPI
jgi:hypothetical protein